MPLEEPEQPSKTVINAQKAREKAEMLYPFETWLAIEERIFIAESRQPWNGNQKKILNKELIQAQILAARESVIYLLPERSSEGRHPDAIVDGMFMEFKTITGTIRQVEERFKEARKQAETVFLKIDSPISPVSVKRKLAEVIMRKSYCEGIIIVYFTHIQHLQYWNVKDLK